MRSVSPSRGRGVFRDISLSSDNTEERLRGTVREGSEVGTLTYQVGQECDSSARWSAMRIMQVRMTPCSLFAVRTHLDLAIDSHEVRGLSSYGTTVLLADVGFTSDNNSFRTFKFRHGDLAYRLVDSF